MPQPLDEVHASIERNYPSALLGKGISGMVLLSIDIDEQGNVQQMKAVRPLMVPGVRVQALLEDSRTGETRPGPEGEGLPHPALRAAAERAVRETRFRPAELDGVPVPFWDFRMSIHMSPPAAARA